MTKTASFRHIRKFSSSSYRNRRLRTAHLLLAQAETCSSTSCHPSHLPLHCHCSYHPDKKSTEISLPIIRRRSMGMHTRNQIRKHNASYQQNTVKIMAKATMGPEFCSTCRNLDDMIPGDTIGTDMINMTCLFDNPFPFLL